MLLGVAEQFALQKNRKTRFLRIHKVSYPEFYKLFKGQRTGDRVVFLVGVRGRVHTSLICLKLVGEILNQSSFELLLYP